MLVIGVVNVITWKYYSSYDTTAHSRLQFLHVSFFVPGPCVPALSPRAGHNQYFSKLYLWINQLTNRSISQPNQSINQLTNQSIKPTVDSQSTNQLINRSNRSPNQPTTQSINQPTINQQINQQINQCINKLLDSPTNQPTNPPTNQSINPGARTNEKIKLNHMAYHTSPRGFHSPIPVVQATVIPSTSPWRSNSDRAAALTGLRHHRHHYGNN